MRVKIWHFDVWGNDVDGYQVNDRWAEYEYLDLKEDQWKSDKAIIKALKKVLCLKRNLHFSSFFLDFFDENAAYIEYKGKPLCELERLED